MNVNECRINFDRMDCRWSKRYRRKLEFIASTSGRIALCVTRSLIDLYVYNTWAQNYNASLKLRPTLVKVANVDSIFYR